MSSRAAHEVHRLKESSTCSSQERVGKSLCALPLVQEKIALRSSTFPRELANRSALFRVHARSPGVGVGGFTTKPARIPPKTLNPKP